MMLIRFLLALGAVVVLAACGSRQHMRSTHGLSLTQARIAQSRPVQGVHHALAELDPDEARLVYEAYRTTLGGKKASTKARPSSVIIVEESDATRPK